MSSSGLWKPVVCMMAVSFALAIVYVLLKKILERGVSHMIIVTYRQAVSCMFLAPLAYFWERRSRPKLTVNILCHLFVSGLLGTTLAQYFFLVGLGYTSSTFSCAFTNMAPAVTFMIALPFGVEKVNIRTNAGRAKVLGTLICVAAAMILTFYKGMPLGSPQSGATTAMTSQGNMSDSTKNTVKWTIGSIFLTASCIIWSSWLLLEVRIGKKYPCQCSSTAIMSFFGTIQSAILSLVMERDFSKWILKGKLEILTVTYAGAVGQGLCYALMSWCVKQKGPVFTAAFTPLAQTYVAILDFSILHAQIYLGSVVGSVLVVIGLYILLWGRARSETKEPELKQAQVTEEAEDCSGRSQV